MDINFIITIFGLWLIYDSIIFIIYRRKVSYNYIVTFLFIIGYIYINYITDQLNDFRIIYDQITILVIMIIMVFNTITLKNNKDNPKIYSNDVKKELKNLKINSELLRLRFISTLEIIRDGFCFEDDNEMSFGTDKFIENIGIENNYFNNIEYYNKIHPEDLQDYKNLIQNKIKNNRIYTTTYRVKKNDKYFWIKETGKFFKNYKSKYRIFSIEKLDIRQYPRTEIDLLNTLKNREELLSEISKKISEKNEFNLFVIELSNIPIINTKYGRDFGDLFIANYLKNIQYKFLRDTSEIFRIEGIKFGFVITENAKIKLLESAAIKNKELLYFEMTFGGIRQTVYPRVGYYKALNKDVKAEYILQKSIDSLNKNETYDQL